MSSSIFITTIIKMVYIYKYKEVCIEIHTYKCNNVILHSQCVHIHIRTNTKLKLDVLNKQFLLKKKINKE
jgi:hypothetical protein